MDKLEKRGHMMAEEKYASIADSGKPNAGRIYDYLLGGNHNFEVDRQAAEQAVKLMPFFPRLFKLVRWFLGEAVRRLCEEGYTQFIDFASGLPTVDHIHEVAPAGTKVVYSDIDPVTVAYAHEIIKDNPNVRYGVCPAQKPNELLNTPLVTQFIDANRKVAIGFNGVAYFLTDKELGNSMKVLYDWAGKGSRLFTCDLGFEEAALRTSATKEMAALYEKLGQPVYWRSRKTFETLAKPWKVREPGMQPLESWVGVKGGGAEESGREGFVMVGAILEK
jgi:O-methyltransferase involved in polyketide biosynthesis